MSTNNTANGAEGTRKSNSAPTMDWGFAWKSLQEQRRKRDDAGFWTKRSNNFDRPNNPSPYVVDFIARCELDVGDMVLDMGCGTGSIAVPLALKGHRVLAADFSSGMIACTRERSAAAGVQDLVDARIMAWEDDWSAHGIGQKSVDVALASRSLSVADLQEALEKLSSVAQKKCCISTSCGYSPRMDARILDICGLENLHGKDFQYAWNILVDMGYEPTCSFIKSLRKDTFANLDDAKADFGRMIDDVAHLYPATTIADAHVRLNAWLADHLVRNEDAGKIDEKGYPEDAWRLDQPRVVPWAFISWEV